MTKLLTLKDVCEKLSIKRSSIYLWIQNGQFPEPIVIGERNIRWIESEVEGYIKSKKDSRVKDREAQSTKIMTCLGRASELTGSK